MTDILPANEAAQLASCEEVIERGIQTFYEVGTALAKIRDARLYRMDHDTFETYVSSRWGWHRSRAYRMIDAAALQDELSPIGDIPNEGVARALKSIPPDRRAEVWEEAVAVSSGHVTAKLVEGIVKRITAPSGATAGRITSHIGACGMTNNPMADSSDDPTGHRSSVPAESTREAAPLPVSEPLSPPVDQGHAPQGADVSEGRSGHPLAPDRITAARMQARSKIDSLIEQLEDQDLTVGSALDRQRWHRALVALMERTA